MPAEGLTPIAALAAALRGEDLAVSDELVDLAEAHGVEALLARAGSARPASPAVASRLSALLAGYEVLAAVRDRELARVLEHLASGGISPILIKGSHLAHAIYASPSLRPREDTDLVIAEDERDRTARLLEGAGYHRRVHVRGALILGQCHFQRTDGLGLTHALDVHWRLVAPLVLRRLLPAEELRRSRVPIAGLGPDAWGPALPHALVIACVHLVAHHRQSPVLIWQYDIARLAESLGAGDAEVFVDTAARSGVSTVCAAALDLARQYFDRPALASLAARVHAGAIGRAEPSAALLTTARPIDDLWLDLRACEGSRERLALLGQHLWPDADYMRATMAGGGWLPLAYARRALFGARKWMSAAPPTGADRRTAGSDAPTAGSAAASGPPHSA